MSDGGISDKGFTFVVVIMLIWLLIMFTWPFDEE